MRIGPIPPGDFTCAMIELAMRIHKHGIDNGDPSRVIVTRIARAVMTGALLASPDENYAIRDALRNHDEDAHKQGTDAVQTLRELPF